MRLILTLVFVFFAGCAKKNIDIIVSVVSNNQKPVRSAEIFFNGEMVGKSDYVGKFTRTILKNEYKTLKVEISKKSEMNLYAPYVKEIDIENFEEKSIEIHSTLYDIPIDHKEIASPDQKKEEVKPEATKIAIAEIKNEKSENKEIQKSTIKTLPTNLEEKIKINTEKTIALEKKDEIIPSEKVKKSDLLEVKLASKEISTLAKKSPKKALVTKNVTKIVTKLPNITKAPEYKNFITITTFNSSDIENNSDSKEEFLKNSLENNLEKVSVYANKKLVGFTDKNGKLIVGLDHIKGDFVEIALEKEGYFPKLFKTNFILSKNLQLVKIFQKANISKHGYIVSIANETVSVHFPNNPNTMRENETLKVFGLEVSADGHRKETKQIAELNIISINKNLITTQLKQQKPRTILEKFDTVIYTPLSSNENISLENIKEFKNQQSF